MLDWQKRCVSSEGNWVFPNYIRAAGRRANLGKDIDWHTFRHTYRFLLDDAGAPVGVQQKLMRHAQASTTMNTYGNAQMRSKRTANTKVVADGFAFKGGSIGSSLGSSKEKPHTKVGFCGVQYP
jgi:integrase